MIWKRNRTFTVTTCCMLLILHLVRHTFNWSIESGLRFCRVPHQFCSDGVDKMLTVPPALLVLPCHLPFMFLLHFFETFHCSSWDWAMIIPLLNYWVFNLLYRLSLSCGVQSPVKTVIRCVFGFPRTPETASPVSLAIQSAGGSVIVFESACISPDL